MSPDGLPAAAHDSIARSDDWPHTKRLMPWLIAGFMTMVFLIPIDGIRLKIHLPVDSKVDRFALGAMVMVFILRALLRRGAEAKPYRRMTAAMSAALIFVSLALLSVLPNVDRIYRLGQLTFDEKALSQLLAYIAFFLIVATQVRRNEIPAYGRLVLSLAVLTALGTLWESRTGYNIFYELSGKLFSSIATVMPSPTNINPGFGEGRKTIVGPTEHGLALASMLTMALPFAVVRMKEVKTNGARFWCMAAIGLLLAASLATERKTAIIAPVAAFAVLVAYNRRLLRWAPLALVVMVPVIHFVSPGALGTFDILANSQNSSSTEQRVTDYGGIAPDILSHPIIGRGYGSLDSDNSRWYRILDNEYLGEVFQVGFVGLIGYLAMVLSPLFTAHGVIRRAKGRAPEIIAASAGCAAFAVVSGTFDALSFPQAPYAFFFTAGLIAAAAATERVAPRSRSRLRAGIETLRGSKRVRRLRVRAREVLTATAADSTA
jgi:O-antigen ligase